MEKDKNMMNMVKQNLKEIFKWAKKQKSKKENLKEEKNFL